MSLSKLFPLLLLLGCAAEAPPVREDPASAGQAAAHPRTLGEVERLDPEMDELVPPGTSIEVLAEGFEWSEGPLWLPEQEALLFPVRKAWWYIPRRPLGFGEKASQGGGFYAAPNPPFGATFTYYLKESIQTAKQNLLVGGVMGTVALGGGFVFRPHVDVKLQAREEADGNEVGSGYLFAAGGDIPIRIAGAEFFPKARVYFGSIKNVAQDDVSMLGVEFKGTLRTSF